MAALISIGLFALLTGAIFVFAYRYYARPARFYQQLGTVTTPLSESAAAEMDEHRQSGLVRIIRQIGERMPISPEDAGTTRRYLMAAGHRSEEAVAIYYGIKLVCLIVLVFVALYFKASVTRIAVLQIMVVAAAALAGYFGPNMILEHLVSRRHETLKFSLPDALDLMVVCVEAGLGLDQAMVSVSRELKLTHPELCEEFEMVTLEMRGGKRRGEALRNLAERTGEPELRKLIAILIQTDRFGTSMAESLRTHSDFMRIRRRQEAEERANKVGVKLVFPIFFCILPAMLLVVGGPGLLQIFKQLFPLMRQFSASH